MLCIVAVLFTVSLIDSCFAKCVFTVLAALLVSLINYCQPVSTDCSVQSLWVNSAEAH